MLDLKESPLATVSPGVPKLLQEGYFVRFPDNWPAELSNIRGKTFQVNVTNQVPYDLSYIIPSDDYRDVDLSNAASGENLYPENINTLYEVVIGFKPGNYMTHIYVPAGEAVSRLEQASMNPSVASATLRYLGAIKPSDSPYDDKRLFLYFIKNVEPMIFRLFVDTGQDFEKCVLGITVNKCRLAQLASPTPDQQRLAKVIKYYSELRW